MLMIVENPSLHKRGACLHLTPQSEALTPKRIPRRSPFANKKDIPQNQENIFAVDLYEPFLLGNNVN